MLEQRSPAWFAARAGNFTASRMSDLMARLKSGGEAASRKNMIVTLAVERLTGTCVETFSNSAMQRGTDLEPEGLNAYAFEFGVVIEEAAYIVHPEMPRVGCSPDGLIDSDGMIERKCPAAMGKHLDALKTGAHAQEYRWQAQHQLFVTGREWVDMVSYDPRWPNGLQLAVKRVFKNAEDQAELAEEIAKSDAEIEQIVAELRALGNVAEAAE